MQPPFPTSQLSGHSLAPSPHAISPFSTTDEALQHERLKQDSNKDPIFSLIWPSPTPAALHAH